MVDVERLGLPARPVEGEHQLHPERLAQRMLCRERLELADEIGVTAEGEVRGDPILERDQPKLLEARGLGLCEPLVDEVDEWGAAPETEGVPEQRGGPLGRAARELVPTLLDERLETPRVDSFGIDDELVPLRARDERLRPE